MAERMRRTESSRAAPAVADEARPLLLLVTGAGRSGTSMMAGALHHLGFNVTEPFLKANTSNPRGFYESQWSVNFHNRLLKKANVRLTDSRPDAAELVTETTTAAMQKQLQTWLAEALGDAGQVVVKDPRTVWTLGLWSRAAAELEMRIGYVVMLRHPAEVLGSRATYYGTALDRYGARGYATKNLATWTNANLTAERGTREHPRCFMSYEDMLHDWRASISHVMDTLCPAAPPGGAGQGGAAVDAFIDAQLHRVTTTWDDLSVPTDLRAVAEDVWSASVQLADKNEAAGTAALFDVAAERYAELYEDALAVSADARDATIRQLRAALASQTQRAGDSQLAGPGLSARGARRLAKLFRSH
jgi:hypothetical protein